MGNTAAEQARLDKHYAEIRARLKDGDIVAHLKEMESMAAASQRYFYSVCPVVKAIANDIETAGRLYSAPDNKKLYMHRGHGAVSCHEQHINTTYTDKKEPDVAVVLKMRISLWEDDDTEDGVETTEYISLYPPISLFKKFDKKVFDKWANSVNKDREDDKIAHDLETLKTLIGKYPKKAAAMVQTAIPPRHGR